jgi:hypothetical protein
MSKSGHTFRQSQQLITAKEVVLIQQAFEQFSFLSETELVIPLLSEFLEYQLGDQQKSKQDCELRAFYRLCNKLKGYFSHLPIILLLDGLYANGPMVDYCDRKNWQFMIVLKEDSLSTVWQEFEALCQLQPKNQMEQSWGRREQSFRWVDKIEYPFGRENKSLWLHPTPLNNGSTFYIYKEGGSANA